MNNIDNLINNASSQAQNNSHQGKNFHNQGQEFVPQNTQGQNFQNQGQNNPNQGQEFVPQNTQGQNPQGQNFQNQGQEFVPQNTQGQNFHNQGQEFVPQNNQYQGQEQNGQGFAPQNGQTQGQEFIPNQNNMVPQQGNMAPQNNHMMQQNNHMMQQQNSMAQQQNHMMPHQNHMMQQQNNMAPQGNLPAHLQQYAVPMEMSMESLDAMGMQVDHWLKPDYTGMMIGDTPSPIHSAIVTIDMTKGSGFTPGLGLRYSKDPVIYDFTIDGATSTKSGAPWFNSISNAVAVDPQARPYSAAQLVFEVAEDIVSQDGTLLASVGESLGYTTPQSNWHDWSKFYKLCVKQGLLGQTLLVKITNVARTKDTYKWGIVKFEIVDQAKETNVA